MNRPDNQQTDRGGDPTPRTSVSDATINVAPQAAADATIQIPPAAPPATAASAPMKAWLIRTIQLHKSAQHESQSRMAHHGWAQHALRVTSLHKLQAWAHVIAPRPTAGGAYDQDTC